MMQANPFADLIPGNRGAPQPLIPRTPPPQTATQDAIDRERLAALRRAAAREEGAPVPGDENLTGPAYLNSLHDPALARQAQAMAEGRIPWPSGRAATDAHWQRIIAAAGQYDPTFDQATSHSRQAAIQQFTGNGQAARTIGSINRIANHLRDLNTASEALAGPDLLERHLSSAAAYAGQSFQGPELDTYNTALQQVAGELEKISTGGSGTLQGREDTMSHLSPNQSLAARRAAIREVVSLIHGAVDPLVAQYNSAFQDGTSRPQIPWISPDAQQTYRQVGGIDFTLPGAPGAAGGAPPSGPPPVVGGPPNTPGSPPQGGMPQIHPNGSPGFEAASSDTPPDRTVTPMFIRVANEAQGLFDGGATRQQMDALMVRRGFPPFGPELDNAIRYRDQGGHGARILPPDAPTPAAIRAAQTDQLVGQAGTGHLLMHGAMLGLGDEAAGVGGALENVLSAPFTGNFDPVGTYQEARDADRIRTQEARDHSGWAGTGADVLGSLASVNPAATAEAVAPSLWARMRAGARGGATIGAVSGFGGGSGLGGSVKNAAIGAGGGTVLGVAAPVVAEGATAVARGTRGLYRLATGDNPDLARNTVAQAFTDDANSPASVAAEMQQAHENGVPFMPADSGDNARGMLASLARTPGSARTLTRDALRSRQDALPDRVTAAIERDLGPATNPHQVAADLTAQAQSAAAPLYEAAYARPGADSFAQRMGNLLRRPSMQGALQRARGIAAEEGRDPNTAGFDVNSSGEVSVNQTPSWQTLDYVKRGLDDVIGAQPRNPATGQVILDEATRAINNTRRTFLEQFDGANSDYAAARAAYAGPVQGRDAMELGRRSLNLSADDLSARINRMSPFEQEMFQLGHRRAMVEHVAGRGDQSDMVNALIGTGKKRAALARLYGDNENFPRFVSTLQAEQAGHQTFRQALTGSPTAPNLQDDAALPGAITAGITDLATTGGLPVASGIRQAIKLGASRVGRNAQEDISTLLSENDPARLSELARVLQEHAAKVSAAQAAAQTRSRGYGIGAGSFVGSAIQDAYGR